MKTLFSWHTHHIDPSSVCYRLASKPSTAAVTMFFMLTGILAHRKWGREELCKRVICYIQCWLRVQDLSSFYFILYFTFSVLPHKARGGYKVGTCIGKYEESFPWSSAPLFFFQGAALYSHKLPNSSWILQWVLESFPSKKRNAYLKHNRKLVQRLVS